MPPTYALAVQIAQQDRVRVRLVGLAAVVNLNIFQPPLTADESRKHIPTAIRVIALESSDRSSWLHKKKPLSQASDHASDT